MLHPQYLYFFDVSYSIWLVHTDLEMVTVASARAGAIHSPPVETFHAAGSMRRRGVDEEPCGEKRNDFGPSLRSWEAAAKLTSSIPVFDTKAAGLLSTMLCSVQCLLRVIGTRH